LILERRGEMRHPDPERAVAFGLFVVQSAVRERILFPDGPASDVDVSRDELVRELTRGHARALLCVSLCKPAGVGGAAGA
jgi:hypothetical protein